MVVINKNSLLMALLWQSFVWGDGSSIRDNLDLQYGGAELVNITKDNSKKAVPQNHVVPNVITAPSVASIIRAADIKALGATDLDDLLATIPGFHVARTIVSVNPTYVIRGNYSTFNQRILVLINGIPTSHLYFNNRGTTWGGMPVQRIERVEIVRGPGSAIYGADAFSGVINVITKGYDDIENKVGGGVGSFDTQRAWLQNKTQWGSLNSAFSLEYLTTDGSSGKVKTDAATTATNNVSLAPGELNREREAIDSEWQLSSDNWGLRLSYQGRFNVGTGAGHAGALDPEGEQNTYRVTGDFTHKLQFDNQHWDLTTQLSVLHIDEDIDLKVFPNGYFGVFPNGVIGEPSYKERHYRGNLTGIYKGFKHHTLLSGIGHTYGKLFDIEETKNFDALGAPLGSVINATNNPSLIFILPKDRRVNFFFIQDEWDIGGDLTLTAGIRYDNYSDFGDTVNQRLALVWQASFNLTLKLLYGSAFRPPSFADLYLINNPAAEGNPNLEPETVDTLELVFLYKPTLNIELALNTYYYEMDDLIENIPGATGNILSQNSGEQTGYGFESEVTWQYSPTTKFISHFSWQNTEDKISSKNAGNAPHYLAYLRADVEVSGNVFFSTQVNWVGPQKRVPGDNRRDIDGTITTAFNLRYKHTPDWAIGLTISNAFNGNRRDPSASALPDDIPGAKRAVQIFFEYTYQ